MNTINKSWKTSLAGIVGLVGGTIVTYSQLNPGALNHNVIVFGQICAAISLPLIGLFARDNDKSSEQVGAGNIPPTPVTVVEKPVEEKKP